MDPALIDSLLPGNGDSLLQMLSFLVILAFIPLIVLTTTPFMRIIIVLYLLRSAIGLQTTPPNLVITGLSMILTAFVMSGPIQTINETSIMPLARNEISLGQAMSNAYPALQERMLEQVDQKDLRFVYDLSEDVIPESPYDVDFIHLTAAHILTELRVAFSIGFVIYIPFLVVDLIVANTLLALGMMMLAPTIISLPFKLMIFVGVDGWGLVIKGLAESFK